MSEQRELTFDQALAECQRRGLRPIRGGVVAAIAIAVVAALASAYAAYSQSQAQAAASRYNAKVAQNQATNAQNAAAVEAQVRGEHYRRQMASQRAAIGASGIAPDEGSPLLVQMDSAEQASLDLARVRYAGEVRATNYTAEQNLQKYYAKTYTQQGYVGAGTALLQGLSSAAGAYARGSSGGTGSYSYMAGSNYYSSDK